MNKHKQTILDALNYVKDDDGAILWLAEDGENGEYMLLVDAAIAAVEAWRDVQQPDPQWEQCPFCSCQRRT